MNITRLVALCQGLEIPFNEIDQLVEMTIMQKWLREKHDVIIVIGDEDTGEGHFVYTYEIRYTTPEEAAKKRPKRTFLWSFSASSGTYDGGWNTYEEALAMALKKALTACHIPQTA